MSECWRSQTVSCDFKPFFIEPARVVTCLHFVCSFATQKRKGTILNCNAKQQYLDKVNMISNTDPYDLATQDWITDTVISSTHKPRYCKLYRFWPESQKFLYSAFSLNDSNHFKLHTWVKDALWPSIDLLSLSPWKKHNMIQLIHQNRIRRHKMTQKIDKMTQNVFHSLFIFLRCIKFTAIFCLLNSVCGQTKQVQVD